MFPEVVLGGIGTVPSGSVARLFSVFVLAGLLISATHPRVGRNMITVGGALVLVQAVTRLYLGRHLLGDIVGGALLGVALVAVAMMFLSRRASPQQDDVPADAVPETSR